MLTRSTSVSIYKSTRTLPYVYLCKEKDSPYYYIGYRYKNSVPSSEDFGTHYFTSNKYVKENFEKFEYIILAEFFDRQSAYQFECNLIKELRSEFMLNRQGKNIRKNYKKSIIDLSPKVCALPGCQKIFSNWRSKCCCISHSKKYAAFLSHR